MDKDLLKKILKNTGLIILFAVIGIVGIQLSQSPDIETIQRYGNTIYPGKDFVNFALPALSLLGSLYFVYREIKLLFQLFASGGPKVKAGCILWLVIPLVLFILIISMDMSRTKEKAKLQIPTETAIAKLHSAKPNGVYTVGIDIAPGWWVYTRPSDVDNQVEKLCHWVIIASDGHEIHPFYEENQPVSASDSRQGIGSAMKNGIEIPLEIKPGDKEFRNIDCGEIRFDDFQNHH